MGVFQGADVVHIYVYIYIYIYTYIYREREIVHSECSVGVVKGLGVFLFEVHTQTSQTNKKVSLDVCACGRSLGVVLERVGVV